MLQIRKDKQKIKQLFEGEKLNVAVLGHTHPDGDALGSGLAMKEMLIRLGHNVSFITPDPFPSFLAWMKDADCILTHTKQAEKVEQIIKDASVVIFVDMNCVLRLESLSVFMTSVFDEKTTILFDHHISPDENFSLSYWDTEVSSTSELIYNFFEESGFLHMLDKQIAEYLYVGIMTDTGSFSYSCNSPETYLILARLFELGIDGAYIHQQVYSTFTEKRLRLLGYSLSEKLTVHQDKGGAYIALSAADLKEYNYKVGDTEGLVNYTMTIQGIHFGVLLTEMEEYIKISLRSEGDIDVNQIANTYFNGGGHRNAAGAYFYGSLSEACLVIDTIINQHLHDA